MSWGRSRSKQGLQFCNIEVSLHTFTCGGLIESILGRHRDVEPMFRSLVVSSTNAVVSGLNGNP